MGTKKKDKLVYGWGVNDIDRPVVKTDVICGKRKQVWICPYYTKWSKMVQRCYDKNSEDSRPTYTDCEVFGEWKYLSNFIKWVDSQPNRGWMNCELDKDLLGSGKIYSPETCCFIPKYLNNFVKSAGCIGTHWDKSKKKFICSCSNPFTGEGEYLGQFENEVDSVTTYIQKKAEHAIRLAKLQTDDRVAAALYRLFKR